MDLGCPSTDRHGICTQNWGGVEAYHLLSIFSPRSVKIWRGKTSIFEDRRQFEAHNFEAAKHIDKRISDVSSRINALQIGIKLGAIAPRNVSAT